MECNKENLDKACAEIMKFKADMNGTNILDPLKVAFEKIESSKNNEGNLCPKRVFMLTDGCVNNEYEIIEYI